MQDTQSRNALKRITFSLLFMAAGYALCNNIIGVTLNPMIEDFSLKGAAQGTMNSMIQLGGIIALLISPLLQGKVKKLYIIIVMGFMQAVALLLTGVAGNYAMLLFACALLGLAFVATDNFMNSYMVDLNPGDSKMLGLTHGCFGVGGLFAPIFVKAVMNRSGWRVSYLISALIFAVFCVVVTTVGLTNSRHAAKQQTAKEAPLSLSMLKDYFRSKRNLLLLGASILYAVAQMGILNWVDYYMVRRFNAMDLGAWCLSVYWITSAVSRIYGTRLPIPAKTVQAWGNVISGIALLAAVVAGSPEAMLIASGVIGLTSGLCVPVLVSEAAIGNEDRTSLTTSAIFLSANVIRLIMNPVFGAVTVTMVMLIPAVCSLLAGMLGFMANRCPVK